jgi:DNA polymerase-3 subunit alpha (Gram-positive type)
MADFVLKIEKKMEVLNKNMKFAKRRVCPVCKTKIPKNNKDVLVCKQCETKLYFKKHPKTKKPLLLTNDEIPHFEYLKNEFRNINKFYYKANTYGITLNEQRLKELRVEFMNKLIEKYSNYSVVDEIFINSQFDVFSVASEIVNKEVQKVYGFKSLYYLSFDKRANSRRYNYVLKYIYNLKLNKKILKELFYEYNPSADQFLFNFIYNDYQDYAKAKDRESEESVFNKKIVDEMNESVDLNGTFVVLDLETTGLSKDQNKIIEIGAVKIKDGVIIEEFSELVDPKVSINPYIRKLTSISDEDVAGKDTEDIVLKRFMQFLDGVDYLVGHNIKGFDYPFLKLACFKNDIEMGAFPCIDTLDIAMKYLGNYIEKYSLSRLSYYFDIDLTNAHRAIYDVYATYELYQNHLRKYLEGHKDVRIDIVETTKEVKAALMEFFAKKKKFHIDDKYIQKDHYSLTRIRNAEEFFELGNLVSVDFGENSLYLVVKGKTTNYNIDVKFESNFSDIKEISCSCPAAKKYAGLCKHSISVFMTLKSIYKDLESSSKKKSIFKLPGN